MHSWQPHTDVFQNYRFGLRVLSGVQGESAYLLNGLDKEYFRPKYTVKTINLGIIVGVVILVLCLHELFFMWSISLKKIKHIILKSQVAPVPIQDSNVPLNNIGKLS